MTTSSNNSALEKTSDLHVVETRPLIPPSRLHNDIPLDHASANTVSKTRRSIQNILHHSNQKLLVIVGPCSIHDVDAAKELIMSARAHWFEASEENNETKTQSAE